MSKRPPEKRARSTRVSVISKAMRVVDSETRRDVKTRRLLSLEADNYGEEAPKTTEDDDTYDNKEEEVGEKKKKKIKGVSKLAGAGSSIHDKWSRRRPRSLEKLLDELQHSSSCDRNGEPSIYTACAGPSIFPARQFCSVCGLVGSYSCVRCGMRFCSIRCNQNHKETRCLKVGLM